MHSFANQTINNNNKEAKLHQAVEWFQIIWKQFFFQRNDCIIRAKKIFSWEPRLAVTTSFVLFVFILKPPLLRCEYPKISTLPPSSMTIHIPPYSTFITEKKPRWAFFPQCIFYILIGLLLNFDEFAVTLIESENHRHWRQRNKSCRTRIFLFQRKLVKWHVYLMRASSVCSWMWHGNYQELSNNGWQKSQHTNWGKLASEPDDFAVTSRETQRIPWIILSTRWNHKSMVHQKISNLSLANFQIDILCRGKTSKLVHYMTRCFHRLVSPV